MKSRGLIWPLEGSEEVIAEYQLLVAATQFFTKAQRPEGAHFRLVGQAHGREDTSSIEKRMTQSRLVGNSRLAGLLSDLGPSPSPASVGAGVEECLD